MNNWYKEGSIQVGDLIIVDRSETETSYGVCSVHYVHAIQDGELAVTAYGYNYDNSGKNRKCESYNSVFIEKNNKFKILSDKHPLVYEFKNMARKCYD